MTDLNQIVARLSDAQRDAVAGRYSFETPWDQDDGEQALIQKGLWKAKPRWGESRLTPLGLRVRAHLIKETTDD